jgi:hypothetical protein
MIEKVFTIGVYGKSEVDFFDALIKTKVDILYDVRRRRGVRGAQYSFVNSVYLQRKLRELGIGYSHDLSLAPLEKVRTAQKLEDLAKGVNKRAREHLGNAFVQAYVETSLSDFSSESFLASFGPEIRSIALFCVEAAPSACHRSLISARLHFDTNVVIEDL